MRKLVSLSILGIFLAGGLLNAQDPPEKSRTLCDKADPKNKCTPPSPDCQCVEDTLEIVLEGNDDSVLVVKDFAKGQKMKATVIMEVKSPATDVADVQGWSYGVLHDDTVLTILTATTEGTDAATIPPGGIFGFDATSKDNVVLCETNAASCPNPKDGGGFLSAVVLSLRKPLELPAGKRNSIAFAEYETIGKDPGAGGTVIAFTDRMAAKGSPPAAINITIAGNSRLPTTAIDGLITTGGVPVEDCDNTVDDDGDGLIDCLDTVDCPPPCGPAVEDCDNKVDDDGDGLIDCADTANCPAGTAPCGPEAGNCGDTFDNDGDGLTDCADTADCPAGVPPCGEPQACEAWALYFGPAATKSNFDAGAAAEYVITMRNKGKASGFQLGVKATKAGAQTNWQFASTLGADANRLIELLIADEQAVGQTPMTPNQATSNIGTVSDITRGAAISGFANRDFFAFDNDPGVGGPGYTVGYVSDTNPPQGQAGNLIPATADANPCPVNEVLKVALGEGVGVPFNRGDADGNDKFNIIDAILIIQIRVGNIAEKFDCDDALDANNDGTLNTADAVYLLNYIFEEGPPPPAPFRACATEPVGDLPCAQSNCQ
jgi:hypothetical protein